MDRQSANAALSPKNIVGEFSCRLSNVVTASGQRVVVELKHPSHEGTRGLLTIISEEITKNAGHKIK
jgi:hypothetical protein